MNQKNCDFGKFVTCKNLSFYSKQLNEHDTQYPREAVNKYLMKTYLAVNFACGYYILRNFADGKTRQVKVLAKRLTGFWLGHINQALTMVQDSITDHIFDHWHGAGKFIAFKFYLSYGHHFCRDCSLICYLPKVLKVKLFSNNGGQKTPVMLAVIDFS